MPAESSLNVVASSRRTAKFRSMVNLDPLNVRLIAIATRI